MCVPWAEKTLPSTTGREQRLSLGLLALPTFVDGILTLRPTRVHDEIRTETWDAFRLSGTAADP
jgi:hypothetical protein